MDPLANYLLLSLPQSASSSKDSLYNWLEQSVNGGKCPIYDFKIPEFKIGTLDSLVQDSDDLAKLDVQLSSSINKVIDVLTSIYGDSVGLVNASKLVKDKQALDYVESFQWDTSKYRLDKPIKSLVDLIGQEAATLDNDVRAAFTSYNAAKSNLTAADRKKTGDLSVKSLHEIVKPEHFVLDSEHLQTLLVAVPNNLVKDFETSYEKLVQMVVPRSATIIAHDSDYTLFNVVLFKKFAQEFITLSRERKWTPREFTYSEEALNDMRKELDLAKSTETRLKNELTRLAKTAYSDIFQSWFHIKCLRVYVESVLRYGLPPKFYSFLLRLPEKALAKSRAELVDKFGYLGGNAFTKDKKGKVTKDDSLHEYASLVDADYEPFVLYEVVVA